MVRQLGAVTRGEQQVRWGKSEHTSLHRREIGHCTGDKINEVRTGENKKPRTQQWASCEAMQRFFFQEIVAAITAYKFLTIIITIPE